MSDTKEFFALTHEKVRDAWDEISHGMDLLTDTQKVQAKELALLLPKLREAAMELDVLADLRRVSAGIDEILQSFGDQFGNSLNGSDLSRASSIEDNIAYREKKILDEAARSAAMAILHAAELLEAIIANG